MKVTVHRKAHFNAAHRLHKLDWSDAKNAAVFGKCNNPNFHGHNYELTVSVTGDVNEETGYVIDMKILKEIILEQVEIPFDHKNLNLDVPAFQNLIPTAENIAVVIWNNIKTKLSSDVSLSVTLYETPLNFVTYSGE